MISTFLFLTAVVVSLVRLVCGLNATFIKPAQQRAALMYRAQPSRKTGFVWCLWHSVRVFITVGQRRDLDEYECEMFVCEYLTDQIKHRLSLEREMVGKMPKHRERLVCDLIASDDLTRHLQSPTPTRSRKR